MMMGALLHIASLRISQTVILVLVLVAKAPLIETLYYTLHESIPQEGQSPTMDDLPGKII